MNLFDQVTVAMTACECSECAISYMVPAAYKQHRREDHKTFWCPNGHTQHFPAETEAERLRKVLAAKEIEATRAKQQADAERARMLEEAKRIARRTRAGACPCCNRTFKQLAAHMKSKHPA